MGNYESESKLENRMLEQLRKQGYQYIKINDVIELERNFREQVNLHNRGELNFKDLSDKEFERLMVRISGKGVFQSAKELRQKQAIQRDDGSIVYIELFNTKDWCKNTFQVTHQTTVEGKYTNRYDVTILINGLPLVQIEIKRRGIDMKEAFNQIKRYKRHSYLGLYKFIQLFIISNGVDTKYFANGDQELNYGFTFYWTDVNNERITNLEQFCVFFLDRCHIAKMIARYMIVNETEKMLIVMRPYQVYAVENIVARALDTNNNGYIWHTTGSGKTITSFKTSQILSLEPSINQVFFLVDRKDLDKQTLDEFNKFDPGCVDMTNQTDKLIQQIKDSTKPLIITTIQKMANACSNPKYASVMEKYLAIKNKKYIEKELKEEIVKNNISLNELIQNIPATELKDYILKIIFNKNFSDYLVLDFNDFEVDFLKYLPSQSYEYYYNNLYNYVMINDEIRFDCKYIIKDLINSEKYEEAFFCY